MIAAISLVLLVIGWLIVNLLGAPPSYFYQTTNKWDAIGVLIAFVGVVGMLTSVLILLVRYAP